MSAYDAPQEGEDLPPRMVTPTYKQPAYWWHEGEEYDSTPDGEWTRVMIVGALIVLLFLLATGAIVRI